MHPIKIIIECKKCKSNLLIKQTTLNVKEGTQKLVKTDGQYYYYDVTVYCPECQTENELKEVSLISQAFIFR